MTASRAHLGEGDSWLAGNFALVTDEVRSEVSLGVGEDGSVRDMPLGRDDLDPAVERDSKHPASLAVPVEEGKTLYRVIRRMKELWEDGGAVMGSGE